MTRRIVGRCRHCGDDVHPKGNVFRLMPSWEFEMETRSEHVAPEGCDTVKVCNNCGFPHPYHPRVSARVRRLNDLMRRLETESS